MSATVIASINTGVVASNSTFQCLGITRLNNETTDTRAYIPIRQAGTLSKLRANVNGQALGGSAFTIRTRKGASAANQSVAVPLNTTGIFEDGSNSDTVSAGDQFLYGTDTVTGAGVATTCSICVTFTPTTTSDLYMRWAGKSNSLASATTQYRPIPSNGGSDTVAANVSCYVCGACAMRDLYARVATNTLNGATTIVTHINSGDGSVTLTVPTSTSGLFEDSTNTDTLTTADQVSVKLSSAGSSGSAVIYTAPAFITSTGVIPWIGTRTGGNTVAAGATAAFVPAGLTSDGTTESDLSLPARLATTLTTLGINVTTNGVSATSTYKFRINAGNGTLSCSIPSSTTGQFEDSTNSDTVATTDLINTAVVAGAGGTSLVFTYTYLLWGGSIAAGQPTMRRWGGVPFLGGTGNKGLGRAWG